MEYTQDIEKLLHTAFDIKNLSVVDDSASHAGHREASGEGGTHFNIEITATDFLGKTMVQRHRMIYKALDKQMKTHIHALALKVFAPGENE